MQYLYYQEASSPMLTLTGDAHRYLFRVRRHKSGEQVVLRNLKDDTLYHYEIISMDKREATLHLVSQETVQIEAPRKLHLGWCVIDPKSIEKVLPSLNELGVDQITFIYCDRSQKSFKLDFARWQKILLNSSQQCGRSQQMKLAQVESLADFLENHPEAHLLHFSKQTLLQAQEIVTIIIGCEGGLSEQECLLFSPEKIIGLQTPMILRSESAAVVAAGLLLL